VGPRVGLDAVVKRSQGLQNMISFKIDLFCLFIVTAVLSYTVLEMLEVHKDYHHHLNIAGLMMGRSSA
jgi:hypothetical protein